MAVWRLGGVVSCGDSGLKADTIQYQVKQVNGECIWDTYQTIYFQLKEIEAKFVVCGLETEKEVKKALTNVENVCPLAIERIDGCHDLVAMAEDALEGIIDRSCTDYTGTGNILKQNY